MFDNEVTLNRDGVLEAAGFPPFAYSDGRDNERYLHNVLDAATDLSTTSRELEVHIKDWPTEYHLSRKRAQLLNGLNYDADSAVLEVGCGCGAITRFLGETFDEVVSVEGSANRAALARKRCRDLDNVTIIAAPFQAIRFRRKFDIVFCIGVFEYSSSFVDAADPYTAIIEYFADVLTDDGVLVLAIENRFGLKYFASASEDHTKTRYDGLEGYRRSPEKARTFGYTELQRMLSSRFTTTEFVLPLPDYKVPDGVVAERLLAYIDAAPLLAGFRSRDYLRPYAPTFDERLCWQGLMANDQVAFFANSFLIIATKHGATNRVRMDDLAVVYNRARAEPFQTRTRLYHDATTDAVMLEKTPLAGTAAARDGFTLLPYREPWRDGETIHARCLHRALAHRAQFHEIFAPAASWLQAVHKLAVNEEVDGARIDAIWQNCVDTDDDVTFIDQEWRSAEPISVNVLFIRAIYWFLVDLRSYPSLARCLHWRSTASIIHAVAAQFDIKLTDADFDAFVAFETRLHSAAFACSPTRARLRFKTILRAPQQTIRQLQRGARGLSAARFYAAKAVRIAKRLYHDHRNAP